jgi:hypothetical protein
MSVKLTVKQIAQASEDVKLLNKAVCIGLSKYTEETNTKAFEETRQAYQRLYYLIQDLNKAELTVKG